MQEQLLVCGFMQGHTQWMSDEDDQEEVNGAAANGNEEEGNMKLLTMKRLPHTMMEINIMVNNMWKMWTCRRSSL
jgi:hypothetical protein